MRFSGLVFLFIWGCNCGPTSEARRTGPSSAGNDGGSGDTRNPDAGRIACPFPCASGEFCGAAGRCIPQGACSGTADCSDGQFCSVTSKCIPTGSCAADDDCSGGSMCQVATRTCTIGSMCGATQVNAGRVAPNLIIALDRSCSMRSRVGTKTKWQIAVDAITQLTRSNRDKIRFGLTMFPDTEGTACSQGMIPLPIRPGNETAIERRLTDALDAGHPDFPKGPCVTNIDTGVQQAATDPGLSDPTHPGFILLLTDGAQAGCTEGGSDMGTLATIRMLRMSGVRTFVIGFDNQGGVDVPALNSFAEAGGEIAPSGLDGGAKFFNAEDEQTLRAAFDVIAGRTIGCTYALTTEPPDPNQLFVFFDKQQVAVDPMKMNGWSYSTMSKQVTFYGQACDRLRRGDVTKVDIVYGCPVPPIN